jgi:hypothetical protein
MSKGKRKRNENERLETTKVHARRANEITVGNLPLNPCVPDSTTSVSPLRHRLGPVPVVKPVI